MAKAKSSVATANIEVIQTIGLKGSYKIRVLSLRMLLTIGQAQKRMSVEAPLLQSILETVTSSFFQMEDFASLGTNAVDVFYVLCDTPDLICIDLLKGITKKMDEMAGGVDDDLVSYPVEYLSRLIVLLGHIALQQLIYLDVTVYGELRRRNEVKYRLCSLNHNLQII